MIFKIKQLYRAARNISFTMLPINKKYIYFTNVWRKYNDNPRYISEQIKQVMPDIICIWELDSGESLETPNNIKKVNLSSLKACYYKNRSRIVIDNSIGHACKEFTSESKIKRKLYESLKNRKQINISTWHGTPLKHIFLDAKGNNIYDDFFTTSDVIVVGDNHTVEVLNRASYGKIPIKKIGSPRNDILFNKDENLKKDIKTRLKLPTDKRIVLYAPTFRTIQESQASKFKTGTDYLNSIKLDMFYKTLEKKFDDEWAFVLRVHPGVAESIDLKNLGEQIGGEIYNGNLGNEMSEYLLVSDILITDYSSSMFDYALTKKPCFLFCPDLENYRGFERGLYFDISKLPFSLSTDFNTLINNIDKYSQVDYEQASTMLLDKLGNVDDGKATNRVIELMEEILNGKDINGDN